MNEKDKLKTKMIPFYVHMKNDEKHEIDTFINLEITFENNEIISIKKSNYRCSIDDDINDINIITLNATSNNIKLLNNRERYKTVIEFLDQLEYTTNPDNIKYKSCFIDYEKDYFDINKELKNKYLFYDFYEINTNKI